jgi:hypothetical protein
VDIQLLYNEGSDKIKLKIMSIIIRKVTKKTILSFIGLGGLIFAMAGRFMPWESRMNLGQLESKAKSVALGSGLVGIANADTVTTPVSIDSTPYDSLDNDGSNDGTSGTDSSGGSGDSGPGGP